MAIDATVELQLRHLRIWNIVVGLILAMQAIMIAVLTNDFALPVTATFMNGPPGTAPELHSLFSISLVLGNSCMNWSSGISSPVILKALFAVG